MEKEIDKSNTAEGSTFNFKDGHFDLELKSKNPNKINETDLQKIRKGIIDNFDEFKKIFDNDARKIGVKVELAKGQKGGAEAEKDDQLDLMEIIRLIFVDANPDNIHQVGVIILGVVRELRHYFGIAGLVIGGGYVAPRFQVLFDRG